MGRIPIPFCFPPDTGGKAVVVGRVPQHSAQTRQSVGQDRCDPDTVISAKPFSLFAFVVPLPVGQNRLRKISWYP